MLVETQYLPPIAFFTTLLQNQGLILEQKEHYLKGTYRNRAYIVGANGILRLSVPLVAGKNAQMPIQEVKISYDTNWHKHTWQSILSAYGRSPFWEFYAERFKAIYEKKHLYLWDLNIDLLETVFDILKWKIDINFTIEYQKNILEGDVFDFRNKISPVNDVLIGYKHQTYSQVFQEKLGFIPNLSILDLIFCTGNRAFSILKQSIEME